MNDVDFDELMRKQAILSQQLQAMEDLAKAVEEKNWESFIWMVLGD